MTQVFAQGDEAIVIAKDLESVQVKKAAPRIDDALLVARAASTAEAERSLLLGWNSRAPIIIRELDAYAAPGSSLTVIAEGEGIAEAVEETRAAMRNYVVDYQAGDTTDRATLEAIRPESYQHIIVLCYADQLPVQKADAKTLVTLLHLRDIEMKSG